MCVVTGECPHRLSMLTGTADTPHSSRNEPVSTTGPHTTTYNHIQSVTSPPRHEPSVARRDTGVCVINPRSTINVLQALLLAHICTSCSWHIFACAAPGHIFAGAAPRTHLHALLLAGPWAPASACRCLRQGTEPVLLSGVQRHACTQ